MKAVRIGNDVRNIEIKMTWLAEDFTDWDSLIDFRVVAIKRDQGRNCIEPEKMIKEPGLLRLYFAAHLLKLGVYDILITFKVDDTITPGTYENKALDLQRVFSVVEHTSQEVDSQDQFGIELGQLAEIMSRAEALRVIAERSRVTAEESRVTIEDQRVIAESSRATAETGRVNAESARITAETDREASESTRQQNETTRGTAETAREASESTRQLNEQTRINNEAGRAAAMALKADHGYSSNPKTLKEVENLLRELAGAPDVFGFRYLIGQADDRVDAVNDVVYDHATGVAPAGSKRAKLLSKLRPFQCNLDGSNKEFLQDDVRMTVGWKPSDLTNPLKLQMVQIPRFYYRSFQYDGYNYVLFSEVAPEAILPFTDATQWKEIQPCGYARYRGVSQLVEGQQMLLSYSGQFPTASVNLINFQTSAKNTNAKATVTPYFIYEAITLLMTMEFGRRNAQAFYEGITNASTSYANAAVTGVTDVLTTPSGEVDVEWQPGSFTKQFRWRFIECVYGQITNLLTGIYYVYDAATELNKVYMTRDFAKINTNSNYAEHILIGSTPSVNGWIKEFIPGTIVASELGGSSTTFAADHNYTSATTTTRIARAGGTSNCGGNAGPFYLDSNYSPAYASAAIGASLVLPE